MFKLGHKILSYGRFKILAQACPGCGDGTDPEFFVSSLYISVAIKVRFLKFNTIFLNWFKFFLTSKYLI